MTQHSRKIDPRDWQAHLSCHRGQYENNILVPTPVRSSPKGMWRTMVYSAWSLTKMWGLNVECRTTK